MLLDRETGTHRPAPGGGEARLCGHGVYQEPPAEDAYDRLIYPSLEREARSDLTERASEGAIRTSSP